MTSTIAPLTAQTDSPANLKLKNQARELEGVFLNTLLKEMFGSLKTDKSAFGGGFAEDTWRSMQSEQLSNTIAESGGLGLADSLYTDLLAVQQAGQNFSTTGAMK